MESQNYSNIWASLLFVLMGAVEIYLGMKGILCGSVTWITVDDAHNIIAETTLTGKYALLYSAVFTIGGISWLFLSYLAPRALEAKQKRWSYFALPAAQRRLFIGTLIIWFHCKVCTGIIMVMVK